jgi:ribosomal protein L30E
MKTGNIMIGSVNSTESFKTIDGKSLEISRNNLTTDINKSIKFWNGMKNKKGWEQESNYNLKFWRFLKKQL